MASLTRWTWVWVNSGSWWWTGRPGVLRFLGSQRVGHGWATDLIWSDHLSYNLPLAIFLSWLVIRCYLLIWKWLPLPNAILVINLPKLLIMWLVIHINMDLVIPQASTMPIQLLACNWLEWPLKSLEVLKRKSCHHFLKSKNWAFFLDIRSFKYILMSSQSGIIVKILFMQEIVNLNGYF